MNTIKSGWGICITYVTFFLRARGERGYGVQRVTTYTSTSGSKVKLEESGQCCCDAAFPINSPVSDSCYIASRVFLVKIPAGFHNFLNILVLHYFKGKHCTYS